MEKLIFLLGFLAVFGVADKCFKSTNAKLFCYYGKIDKIDCKCTHVVLPSNSDIKSIEKLKSDVQNTKILITIHEFNEGLIRLLKDAKIDGVAVDLKKIDSKDDLKDFIATLKSKFDADLTIVVSVPTKPELLAKFYDFKGLSKHVDAFVLETGLLGPSRNFTFHPSRLSGLWDTQNADSVVDLVTGLGAPLSKLVITSPVQAFQFKLQNEKHTAVGSPALEVKTIDRDELCAKMSKFNWTLERDQDQAGPYIFRNKEWISFDDDVSIDIKAKYTRIRGLYGMALKDLTQDGGKTDCGYTILESSHKGLSKQSRAPRGAVLQSLQREILDGYGNPSNSHISVSPYRISRIVDVEGKIHTVRADTRTEFACSRQGYFVHPRSCNRFYRCVKFDQHSEDFNVFEFDCPSGLAFDERVEVCVWPGSLPEASACQGSSEIAPVPKERYSCPQKPGYYADPENCRWFFACLDHGDSEMIPYEFRCPFGLVFDEDRLVCEWSWLVPKCHSGNSLLQPSVVYYGGGYGSLENHNLLGLLSPVRLGGVVGTIQVPINKVYSSYQGLGHRGAGLVGGGAHLNQAGVGFDGAGGVAGFENQGGVSHGDQQGAVLIGVNGYQSGGHTSNVGGVSGTAYNQYQANGNVNQGDVSYGKHQGGVLVGADGYQAEGHLSNADAISGSAYNQYQSNGHINQGAVLVGVDGYQTGGHGSNAGGISGTAYNQYQSNGNLNQGDVAYGKHQGAVLVGVDGYQSGEHGSNTGDVSGTSYNQYQSNGNLNQGDVSYEKHQGAVLVGADGYQAGEHGSNAGGVSGTAYNRYQSNVNLNQGDVAYGKHQGAVLVGVDGYQSGEHGSNADDISGTSYNQYQSNGNLNQGDVSYEKHQGAVLVGADGYQAGEHGSNAGGVSGTGYNQYQSNDNLNQGDVAYGKHQGAVLVGADGYQSGEHDSNTGVISGTTYNQYQSNGNLNEAGVSYGKHHEGVLVGADGYQAGGHLSNAGATSYNQYQSNGNQNQGDISHGKHQEIVDGYQSGGVGVDGYQSGGILSTYGSGERSDAVLVGVNGHQSEGGYLNQEGASGIINQAGVSYGGHQDAVLVNSGNNGYGGSGSYGSYKNHENSGVLLGGVNQRKETVDLGVENYGGSSYQNQNQAGYASGQTSSSVGGGLGVQNHGVSIDHNVDNKNFFASESDDVFNGNLNLNQFGFATGGFSHGFIANHQNQGSYKSDDFDRKNVNIVAGGFSAVKNYNQPIIPSVSVVSSTPASIPTVTSVPFPSKADVYYGGVIANVPELQVKVHSPNQVVYRGNVSYANQGYHYPKPSVRFEEGGSYSYQSFNKDYREGQRVGGRQKTILQPATSFGYSSAGKTAIDHVAVTPATVLVDVPKPVQTYQQKLDLVQHVTPSVLIGKQPVTVEVEKPVSTFTFVRKDYEGNVGTVAPTVLTENQQKSYNYQSYNQNLDTIQHVTPSVLIDTQPVNVKLEKPVSSYNFQTYHKNDYDDKVDTIQHATPSVLIEEKPLNIEVKKPVSSYSFGTYNKNNYQQNLDVVQHVTPSVLIEDRPVQVEVQKPVSTYNFETYNKHDYQQQKVDVPQHVTPSVLIEEKPLNIEVQKPVSSYSFGTYNKNNYQENLDVVQHVTPSVLIEDRPLQVEVQKPVSAFNFGTYNRHDYQQQKVDVAQHVTPSVLIEEKPLNIEVKKPVSSYSFGTYNKNNYQQNLDVVQHVTPSVLIDDRPVLVEVQKPVSTYNFGTYNRHDYQQQKVDVPQHVTPSILIEEKPLNIEVQKPVSSYSFGTYNKNNYQENLDVVQHVTPSVLIENGPVQVEVQKPVSSFNFGTYNKHDYQQQKVDVPEHVTPSILIEEQPLNIEVQKPVSSYSFGTYNKNDYQQNLDVVQHATPSVLIEDRPVQIEVKKPVSPFNFGTYNRHDYQQQKVDEAQHVTPSVLIEEKPLNIEVQKPVSSYSFGTYNKNDYQQNLDVVQHVTPAVLIEDRPLQVEVQKPVSTYDFQTYHRDDYNQQIDVTPSSVPLVDVEVQKPEIHIQKPISTYTFNRKDYRGKVGTVQHVTPTVLIENQQIDNSETYNRNDYHQNVKAVQKPVLGTYDSLVPIDESKGYNYVKPVSGPDYYKYSFGTRTKPLEPVSETPFVKKTAYVTGDHYYDQKSNLLGTYTISSTPRVYLKTPTQTVLVPTTEKVFYTTVKPSYKTILSTAKTVEPLQFYIHDSRLSTTPKIDENSRKYLPPVVTSTSTSKPYLEVTTPYVEITSIPLRKTIVESYEREPTKRPVKVIKVVRPKTKAIVKVNDFYPMLPAKLGAQCTCVSNTVKLRKRPQQKIKYEEIINEDDDDDDGYVVDDGKYESEKVVEVTQIPKKKLVVKVDEEVTDKEIKQAVKTGLKLIKSAAKEGAKEALENYDKSGGRSRLESLQGIDCQRAGLFRHPTQCNKFYSCVYDCDKKKFKLHVFNCPVHLTFDSNLGACNWPSKGPTCAGNTLLPSE